jgi:Na+/H+-dicarboxylate symporter
VRCHRAVPDGRYAWDHEKSAVHVGGQTVLVTRTVARVAATAALLVGTAALPATAMADMRASQTGDKQEESAGTDWALLGVACVTLIVGRTVVYRRTRAKAQATAPAPSTESH